MQFRPHAALVALAAGALLATAAGCGERDEENTLTKAEVIARGSAICKQAERMNERLPLPRSDDPFAKGTSRAERLTAREYLAGTADALEFSRNGLRRLDAPAEDRELLADYIHDIGVVVTKLRAAAAAPAAEVEARAEQAIGMFQAASRHTAAYGFPKDACGE